MTKDEIKIPLGDDNERTIWLKVSDFEEVTIDGPQIPHARA